MRLGYQARCPSREPRSAGRRSGDAGGLVEELRPRPLRGRALRRSIVTTGGGDGGERGIGDLALFVAPQLVAVV